MSVSIKERCNKSLRVVENPGVKTPSLGEYQFEADEDTESYESEFAYKTSFEYRVSWMFENGKNIIYLVCAKT